MGNVQLWDRIENTEYILDLISLDHINVPVHLSKNLAPGLDALLLWEIAGDLYIYYHIDMKMAFGELVWVLAGASLHEW